MSLSNGDSTSIWVFNTFRFDWLRLRDYNSYWVCNHRALYNCCYWVLYLKIFVQNLFHSDDPATFEFDADRVRSHLSATVRHGTLTPFPFLPRCYCRGPAGGRMVQCDGCSDWFHRSCLSPGNRVCAKRGWWCRYCRWWLGVVEELSCILSV